MTLSAKELDLAKRASKAAMGKVAHHLKMAGQHHAKGMGFLAKCGAMMGKAAGGTEVLKAADAMAHLNSAHGHFSEAGDHMEMAHMALSNASEVTNGTGTTGDNVMDPGTGGANSAVHHVSAVSESTRTEGDVPWYSADKPYPGTQAADKGMFTQGQVDALIKAATAEATTAATLKENETLKALLSKTPSGGARPALFAVDKTGVFDTKNAKGNTPRELLLEGIDTLDVGTDQNKALKAAGEMVNNMIANRDVFAKSVFDPAFRGKAGLAR